ncbi:MAG: hypothetical protein ACP5JJ_12125, partial [Anaerolineae bacterium]
DRWLAKQVGLERRVMTSMMLAPHLVNRRILYLFDYPSEPYFYRITERLKDVEVAIPDALYDYVAPDVVAGGFATGHPSPDVGGVTRDVPAIETLLTSPDFRLVDMCDGLLLFRRDAPPEAALVQEFSVAISELSDGTQASFGDLIGLVTASIGTEADHLQLQCAWMALAPLAEEPPLMAVSRLEGVADGRIVHLPTLVMYPTTRWEQGQVITETFQVPLPPDMVGGAYRLLTGWYDTSSVFASRTDERSRLGEEAVIGIVMIP